MMIDVCSNLAVIPDASPSVCCDEIWSVRGNCASAIRRAPQNEPSHTQIHNLTAAGSSNTPSPRSRLTVASLYWSLHLVIHLRGPSRRYPSVYFAKEREACPLTKFHR